MSFDLFPLLEDGSLRSLAKEETMFLTGAPVRSMFLVVKGQVDLVRHTETGLLTLLCRAGPGSVLAEASAYSEAYHCDGTAVEPAQVRSVPLATSKLSVKSTLTQVQGLPANDPEITCAFLSAEKSQGGMAGCTSVTPRPFTSAGRSTVRFSRGREFQRVVTRLTGFSGGPPEGLRRACSLVILLPE